MKGSLLTEQLEKIKSARPKPPSRKGKHQTPNMELSTDIAWLSYQLSGSIANLDQAVGRVKRNSAKRNCTEEAQREMFDIVREMWELTSKLKVIEARVKKVNKNKMPAKIPKTPQTPSKAS